MLGSAFSLLLDLALFSSLGLRFDPALDPGFPVPFLCLDIEFFDLAPGLAFDLFFDKGLFGLFFWTPGFLA